MDADELLGAESPRELGESIYEASGEKFSNLDDLEKKNKHFKKSDLPWQPGGKLKDE